MPRTVRVKMEINVTMVVDDDIAVSKIIEELDYDMNDTTTKADITNTEIVDYEIIDSK